MSSILGALKEQVMSALQPQPQNTAGFTPNESKTGFMARSGGSDRGLQPDPVFGTGLDALSLATSAGELGAAGMALKETPHAAALMESLGSGRGLGGFKDTLSTIKNFGTQEERTRRIFDTASKVDAAGTASRRYQQLRQLPHTNVSISAEDLAKMSSPEAHALLNPLSGPATKVTPNIAGEALTGIRGRAPSSIDNPIATEILSWARKAQKGDW